MVHGADFSSYQDDAAVAAALKHGLEFAFVKLTEGGGGPSKPYLNPRAAAQLATLRAHGLRLGLYHYLDPAGPLGQWSAFEHALEQLPHHEELILALDYEAAGTTDTEARAFIHDAAEAGYRVGLYHSLSGYPKSIGEAFRWVAAWSKVAPAIAWRFWQFAPGRGGAPDWDLFHGTADELAVFWTRHAGCRPPVRYRVLFPATKRKPAVELGPYKRPRHAALRALAYALAHPSRRSYTVTRSGHK